MTSRLHNSVSYLKTKFVTDSILFYADAFVLVRMYKDTWRLRERRGELSALRDFKFVLSIKVTHF